MCFLLYLVGRCSILMMDVHESRLVSFSPHKRFPPCASSRIAENKCAWQIRIFHITSVRAELQFVQFGFGHREKKGGTKKWWSNAGAVVLLLRSQAVRLTGESDSRASLK